MGAPIVNIPSPLHPLEIRYAPGTHGRLDERGVTREFLRHLARVAVAEQRAFGGDALVFVPGAREVDAVIHNVQDLLATEVNRPEVLPLHGRLSAAEQDRAVSGAAAHEPTRIVVSTALAESSLTVPGVHLVIDAGLTREVRRDRGRDMTGLVTLSASRSSAEQRAGRAARQGPGRAIRAYSEADFARMPVAATPEILSADLLDAALLLAAWGTPGGTGLKLLTAPPEAGMARAARDLVALGLADEDGTVTELGRRVARLPVGVRDARALLSGSVEIGDPAAVAEVVAALSGDYRDSGADLTRVLRELRVGHAPGSSRWRAEARRLTRIAQTELGSAGSSPSAANVAGTVMAIARPEWIAKRTGLHSRSYLLASGTRAALPEGSPLLSAEWLAVAEVQRVDGRINDGTGAVIRLAAPLSEAEALDIGRSIRSTERAARVSDGRVRVQERRLLGAILLSTTPAAVTKSDTAPAFAAHLREVGLSALTWDEGAQSLRARLALIHRELGSPWPDVGDSALLGSLPEWLGPDLERLKPASSLLGIDVNHALRRILPWPEAARLDELAPEYLAVPSGSRVRISYPVPEDGAAEGVTGARPVVAVKLQELFGFADTPRLVNNRVPILFHLLSPARKPLAITDDLASFWNGPYQDVRRQMRGRYPKHPWPEDPWTAQATARTKRAAAGPGGQ